jgi:hypothetical protein
MIIDHAREIVIVTPPKTGSTSLHAVLPQYRLNQHRIGIPPNARSQYKIAITARHPFPRIVSMWAYGCAVGAFAPNAARCSTSSPAPGPTSSYTEDDDCDRSDCHDPPYSPEYSNGDNSSCRRRGILGRARCWIRRQLNSQRYNISLEEFIRDRQCNMHYFWHRSISAWVRPVPWTHILRQDTLEADLAAFLGEEVTLPRRNRTRHKPWEQLLTKPLQDIVMERWGDDVELYEKGIQWPNHGIVRRPEPTAAS